MDLESHEVMKNNGILTFFDPIRFHYRADEDFVLTTKLYTELMQERVMFWRMVLNFL